MGRKNKRRLVSEQRIDPVDYIADAQTLENFVHRVKFLDRDSKGYALLQEALLEIGVMKRHTIFHNPNIDVISLIFRNLSVREIWDMRYVCHAWNQAVKNITKSLRTVRWKLPNHYSNAAPLMREITAFLRENPNVESLDVVTHKISFAKSEIIHRSFADRILFVDFSYMIPRPKLSPPIAAIMIRYMILILSSALPPQVQENLQKIQYLVLYVKVETSKEYERLIQRHMEWDIMESRLPNLKGLCFIDRNTRETVPFDHEIVPHMFRGLLFDYDEIEKRRRLLASGKLSIAILVE